jgi:hypothetical protein
MMFTMNFIVIKETFLKIEDLDLYQDKGGKFVNRSQILTWIV